ncbi:hypothetical protein Pelo_5450 [Pelomyxa schiedti]|nr:hypothetical protein Pelo_5450 [Pelomyxa schiedti]
MTTASATTTTTTSNDWVVQLAAIDACLKSAGWKIESCANCGTEKATVKCINDNVCLCNKCNEALHTNPIHKSHNRVPIGDSAPNCATHNIGMEFFCCGCAALCCGTCKDQAHTGHAVVSWKTFISEKKRDIHRKVTTALRKLKERNTELLTALEDVNSKGTTAKSELWATFSPLESAILKRKTEFLFQVDAMVEKKRVAIHNQFEATRVLHANVEMRLANENITPRELADLLNKIESECNLPVPPSQISFGSNPLPEVLPAIAKLGCLSEIPGINLTVSTISSSIITVQWSWSTKHRQVEVQISDCVPDNPDNTPIQFSRSIFCVTPECMIPWNDSRIIAVRARVSALDILGAWGPTLILSKTGGGKVFFTQPGIYAFTVPAGVSSVDVIAIGGGEGGDGERRFHGGNSLFGGYAQAAGGGNPYLQVETPTALGGRGFQHYQEKLSASQKYMGRGGCGSPCSKEHTGACNSSGGKYGGGGGSMYGPRSGAPGAYTTMPGIRVTPGESVKVVVGQGGKGGEDCGACSGDGHSGLVVVAWGGMAP